MDNGFEDFYRKHGEIYEQYMHGDCHIFAIALNEELKYPIQLAMDEYDVNIDGEALIHAYCVQDDSAVHVGGKTKIDNILEEFEYNIPYFRDVTVKDINELIKDGFLQGYKKEQLEDIKRHIRSNIELYK